jgi:glyoxylase-like metal-dependent hydrolase (beta-lactamase superfamily II)/rhodanese-related sulfurtransferase
MIVEQFSIPGLAHFSYLVADSGLAAVIDPSRDIDRYLRFAAERNLRIAWVLETHIHADYASGAPALAAASGATLCLSAHTHSQTYQYATAGPMAHRALAHGDRLFLGALQLTALHTPGHTPEHLSFLLAELPAAQGQPSPTPARLNPPLALFSGDFLFLGSIGRPDLLGEAETRALAQSLYRSIRLLAPIPDGTLVYPGHGAGSLCGAGMAARSLSTLGYERATNPFLQPQSESAFLARVLDAVPEFPPYYLRMKHHNALGFPPASTDPLPSFSVAQLLQPPGFLAVPLGVSTPGLDRNPNQHLNQGLNPSSTAGATADATAGASSGANSGLNSGATPSPTPNPTPSPTPNPTPAPGSALAPAYPILLDLRSPEAFGGAHIPGSLNIGLGPDLATWAAWLLSPAPKLPAPPILLIGDAQTDLESARQSLLRVGLDSILGSLRGGIRGWVQAGHPLAHIPQRSALFLQLALEPALQETEPETEPKTESETDAPNPTPLRILDVRSPAEWASGHIPGAHHIPLGLLPAALAARAHPALALNPNNPGQPMHVICGSGYRSSLACSFILRAHPQLNLINIDGGMTAWRRRQLAQPAPAAQPDSVQLPSQPSIA